MAMIRSLRHRLQMWDAFHEMVNIIREGTYIISRASAVEVIAARSLTISMMVLDYGVARSICSGKYAIVCD